MSIPTSFVSRLAVSLSLVHDDERIFMTGDFHSEARAILEAGREMILIATAHMLDTTCIAIAGNLCVYGATSEFAEEVVEFFRNERNDESPET